MQIEGEWISGSEVAKRLCIGKNRVPAIARKNAIRRIHVPGSQPRYNVEDVDRVVASTLRAANLSWQSSKGGKAVAS